MIKVIDDEGRKYLRGKYQELGVDIDNVTCSNAAKATIKLLNEGIIHGYEAHINDNSWYVSVRWHYNHYLIAGS